MGSKDLDFKMFFEQFEPKIRRLVATISPSMNIVDDVVQNVFITSWKKFDQVQGMDEAMALSWLGAVAVRHTSNERKKFARHIRKTITSSNEVVKEVSISTHELFGSLSTDVKLALLKLPIESRTILLLVLWHDCDAAVIAETFNCTHAAAVKRIQRAKEDLRKGFDYEN